MREEKFGKLQVGELFITENSVMPFVKTFNYKDGDSKCNAVAMDGFKTFYPDAYKVLVDDKSESDKKKVCVPLGFPAIMVHMDSLDDKGLYRHAGPVNETTISYEWIGG